VFEPVLTAEVSFGTVVPGGSANAGAAAREATVAAAVTMTSSLFGNRVPVYVLLTNRISGNPSFRTGVVG
jgi:hypothetical protein